MGKKITLNHVKLFMLSPYMKFRSLGFL